MDVEFPYSGMYLQWLNVMAFGAVGCAPDYMYKEDGQQRDKVDGPELNGSRSIQHVVQNACAGMRANVC